MLLLTEENLAGYLVGAASKIDSWGSGVKVVNVEEIKEETYVNYIFRAGLIINGVPLTVYLRQTRDHVKTKPERPLAPERIQFEVKILDILNGIKKDIVPEVLYLDRINNVAILTDIKRGCPLLVNELVAGRVHAETAEYFGGVIAKFHSRTLGIDHSLVRGSAPENKGAVSFHLGMRLEPALKMFPSQTNRLLKDSEKSDKCLVLGDLASKNIFVDGNRVRFLDLERAFVGDPSFDLAFLFCHYLIEVVPDNISDSLDFIEHFMRAYLRVMREALPAKVLDSLSNRVIRFLGVTVLYRLFGFYLVINVQRSKEHWTEVSQKLLSDAISVSVVERLKQLIKT